MPIEVPQTNPGGPTEPPMESPPGNPRPEIPPPMQEPDSPSQPQELPGNTPEEMPTSGPVGQTISDSGTDEGSIDYLPGSEPDVAPGVSEPPSV